MDFRSFYRVMKSVRLFLFKIRKILFFLQGFKKWCVYIEGM